VTEERQGPPTGTIADRMKKRRTQSSAPALTEKAHGQTKAIVKRRGRDDEHPVGGLAYAARYLPGGKNGLMELARGCGDDKVQSVVKAWDTLTSGGRRRTKLEDLCVKECLSPGEMLARVAQDAHDTGLDVSKLIRGVAHPRVLQASIKQALKAEGHRDREMLFKSSGFLPTPTGPTFNNNVSAKAQAAAVTEPVKGLPSFEQDIMTSAITVRGEQV
jgi:hypothetical protein